MRKEIEPIMLRVPGAGITVAVWDYGGEGPPIFFCHCAGVCGRIWDPVISRLTLNNRIFAWDGRGHGDSDKPELAVGYGPFDFAADLLAAMDALEVPEGAWAVGHSGGASTIACAELMRPGRFSRLVLLDAIIAPPQFYPQAAHLAELSRKRRHIFDSPDAARARLGGKPPMNAWSPEALDAYIAHGFEHRADGTIALKCPGEIEAWVYEYSGPIDIFDRLGEITATALVVTGETSYMSAYVRSQHEHIPRTVFETVPGAGHFIPQEKPAETAALINRWFGAG